MSIIAGNIKGITISIGGETTGLQKALGDVNKKTRDVQSELKQVERLLKLDPKNTDLLAQRQKLLAEAVENSREKLDRLKTAQEQVNEQFRKGEINEEQYRAFQREVVKAEQELSKFEKQLKDTGITADQVAKKLGDAGKKMTDMGKNLSMKVTAPIVAVGAASFKFAADLQDAMGASDQIFKDASGSIKSWADNLESYYGIAETEALTYANTMGAMLQNIGGLGEAEASKQAQTLVELAGDLTAMFGGTTESAVQALTGALKGNNSMLDNYGMGVNEATIKAKAFEMGLIKEGEQLDLAGKQAATLALIMEQTADAQGQAAREADGSSGSMRALTTELKNASTELGEVLLPIITPFITKLKEIIQRFGELSPETKKTIVVVAGLAAAIGPLLVAFGLMAQGVGAVIGVVGSLSGLLPLLGTAMGAVTLPIAAVVAAIAGLIAIGVLLYKNWDEIKAFGLRLWEDLKTGWTEGMESIKKAFSDFGQNIKDTWTSMWKSVMEKYNAVKTDITNLTSNLIAWVQDKFTAFKGFFLSIWEGIAGGVRGYINNMIGFINRLIDAFNSIKVEIPEWVPMFGGQRFGIDIPRVPQLATGTNYVPRDMLALLHKGEAVVPAKYNPTNTTSTIIKEINIYGNNPDEIWSKFERKLHKLGVVF